MRIFVAVLKPTGRNSSIRYLTALLFFGLLAAGCGKAPKTEDLDRDIAEVEKQIDDAVVDKKSMGGLATVFASTREQVLMHTKAMLEQKRKSRLRAISLRYTVDGKPYGRPEDYNVRLKRLDEDILDQKVALKEAEMHSGGGLLGALMGATGFLVKFNIALLESQKLFLKHDIPVYSLAQFENQVKEAQTSTAAVTAKPAPKHKSKKPTPSRSKGPSALDFEIVSYRAEWQGGRLRVIGELRNNGSISAGAQIEVMARDDKGVLVDSQSFWPNSTTNIPPGGTCGIGYTITRDSRAKTLEAKVIHATVW